MFAFEPREWRRRRAEDAALSSFVRGIELFAQFETVGAHTREIYSMDQQARQRHKRRIRMVLPVMNFFVVETFVILRARVA